MHNDLKRKMRAFEHLVNEELPDQIEIEAQRIIDESFDKEQYQDGKSKKWAGRIGDSQGRGQRRGLLVKTGGLHNTTTAKRKGDQVVISAAKEYAKIHNEGGKITVTERMKKFFWAMHYSTQEEFWKNMALKRTGSVIEIPQRQFMPVPGGDSNSLLDQRIEKFLDEKMDKIFG